MKILADSSLPALRHFFPRPFELTLYEKTDDLASLLSGQDVLLCRSYLKVNENLLAGHSLKFIATASSGSDHIDQTYLQDHGIQLIDAKGSNAIAVADYVIAVLAFLQKYQNFSGRKAGLIGLGEVGSKVAERFKAAGISVRCYDPLRAAYDKQFVSNSIEELLDCELISIHANLHNNPPFPSKNLLDANFLNQLKPETVIINAARGGIVDEEAILCLKKPLSYCTDVYMNEPTISPEIVNFATLCTPHIAGHSVEAKYLAVAMISEVLHSYLHLSPPSRLFPKLVEPKIPAAAWQDFVLTLYNPLDETTVLKNSQNLAEDFKNLRKAHQHRHDFCNYPVHSESKLLKKLLGRN